MHTVPSILALLASAPYLSAATCEGNATNSCNGLLDKCTSEGNLCVLDSATGACCSLPSAATAAARSASACRSDADGSVCASLAGTTSTQPAVQASADSASDEPCYRVEIGLVLDNKPSEIAWEITSGRKSTLQQPDAEVISTSPYYDEKYVEASDTYLVCLPEGKYTFTMIDLGQDGLCCTYGEGKYALSYQPTGDIIATGASFQSSESTTFKIPFVAPTLKDTDGDGVEDRTKNVIPTIPLTEDGEPSCSNEFGLHLVTDDYGVETTWELRERVDGNYTDGDIIASGGPYTSEFEYDITYCLNPGEYTFVFYDWQCDGLIGRKSNGYFTLSVNGMEVHTGGTEMTSYEEVVDLDFMNALVGGEELEVDAEVADGRASLDKYRVKSGAESGGRSCGWMGLVLMAAANTALAWN